MKMASLSKTLILALYALILSQLYDDLISFLGGALITLGVRANANSFNTSQEEQS